MQQVSSHQVRRTLLFKWAVQDYFVSKRFPCMLGSLIAHIEDPIVRHPLVENLWEEHGEGATTKSHHALYCDLLRSIGLAPVFDKRLANEATRAFIDTQESLARQDVFLGLGAFCYANEFITIEEFGPLEEAVGHEFPTADLSFFKANREVDPHHARQTEDVIEALLTSPEDLQWVEKGAGIALEARVRFYDALLG